MSSSNRPKIGPRTAILFLLGFLLTLPSIATSQDSNQTATSPRLHESLKPSDAVPVDKTECALPKASGAATAVVVGSPGTDALSSTTLGFQDIPTEAGNVIIENGDGPLYIVIVATRPVIWRITGAVNRIEHLVLSSFHPYAPQIPADALISIAGETVSIAGETGVPSGQVTFMSNPECLGVILDGADAKAISAVLQYTGKTPSIITVPRSSAIFLPSGKVNPLDNREAIRKLREKVPTLSSRDPASVTAYMKAYISYYLVAAYPAGVVDIDPGVVVSNRPAARYEVFPRQAGLLQLIEAGSLLATERGDFVIRGKLRLPVESGENFLLQRGVPKPDGDLKRYCVMDEETGEQLGPRCPKSFVEYVQQFVRNSGTRSIK
jgi:hypothetical protein